MPTLKAAYLKDMTGNVADDGHAIIIGFENKDGEKFKCALDLKTLSQTITFLLGLAVETGEKFAPEDRRIQEVTAVPLPVAQIGIAKGRNETEAILAIQLGILRLVFSTELGTLLGMCKDLQSIAVSRPPQKPQ